MEVLKTNPAGNAHISADVQYRWPSTKRQPSFQISSIIRGKNIANGGYGEVFEGIGGPPGLLVVIKRFEKQEDRDTEFQNLRSIQMAGQPHASIVQAFGSYDNNSEHCILLRREGESLTSQLKTICSGPQPEVLGDVGELLDGIHWLHERVGYHLDINPNNILRRQSGSGYVLIDFGTLLPKDSSRNVEQCFNEYASRLDDKVGGWSDVWSTGCVTMVILVWIAGGPNAVSDFRDERKSAQKHAESDSSVTISVPFFDLGTGICPVVGKRLTQLGEKFPEQVPILWGMLEHDRHHRLSMKDASLRWSGSLIN
ncbi:kinase-like domain-containing protein [Trichophaea hybrida]|nr:kinase-like domain-containing protein [Trichophaea hybrida]